MPKVKLFIRRWVSWKRSGWSSFASSYRVAGRADVLKRPTAAPWDLQMNQRVKDLSGKHLSLLDQDEIVYCHLSLRQPERTLDFFVTSCLEAIETEMRQSRGTRLTANYVPLLAAFAILDQIGSCYADKRNPVHPSGGSAIHHALYHFAGMDPMSEEVKALYALRNGLVHDASLTSYAKKTGQWYIFRYDHKLACAIKLPATPWDGTASGLGGSPITFINPRLFTDQVSEALSTLKSCYIERRPDLEVLKSGADILHKYLFWQAIP